MSETLDERIREIIDARTERADLLRRRVGSWTRAGETVRSLQGALDQLAAHRGATTDVVAARDALAFADLAGRIEREVLPRFHRVEQRFSRTTINIGVAGEARVGKSTLLQAISGLGEGQIPTGDDLPVTAVRSRIFHVPGVSRATVRFHTWDTFRTRVLQPYFDKLAWPPAPATPAAFRALDVPPVHDDDEQAGLRQGLRDRVLGMQRSLDSWLPLLGAETARLDLEEIRPLVAYPTADEEGDSSRSPDRKYLAVREALLECEFPGTMVRSIGLLDLPGTGEIVAAGEDRHLAGLEDQVDLVLLVTNPRKKAYWSIEAARTLDIVQQARCGAATHDFCLVVINDGGASDSQVKALRGDIERKTQAGGDARSYTILECDALRPEDVRARLVMPALRHLADRLGDMDAAAVRYAEHGAQDVARELSAMLDRVEQALGEAVPSASPSPVVLVNLTARLRRDLAFELASLVDEMLAAARGAEAEDSAFESAVERCYQRVREWLARGLGRGETQWLRDAEGTLKQNRGSGQLIDDELNRIRVHVADEFTELDDHLSSRVGALWSKVAAILAPKLGVGGDEPGLDFLHGLLRELDAAGCASMARALRDLLAVRLDYRTHFHPRMRQQLDLLSPQVKGPQTSTEMPRITVPPTSEGAAEAFRLLREQGERAGWEAQKALLHDLTIPSLVLHAAIEQFDDGFIRSGDAQDEFLKYTLRRRDEIWPGRFDELDRAHRLVAECLRQLTGARDAASAVRGGAS